ncbi:ALF repeat-containing protein [Actinomadura sp. 3N407]|uniref:ALF repeat-containing protein n=1 Tax=Actinomadura sp. 3N407 TaxID=3457423 RepID=UPI003FCDB26F
MRLPFAALAIATTALTPMLLFATPSLATDTAGSSPTRIAVTDDPTKPVDEMTDDEVRIAIMRIIADPDTGRAVNTAAQEAMDGTIEDQRTFLKTGLAVAQAEDDRVAIARILFIARQNNYKAVIREANKALDNGSPAVLRAFLETGHRLAQAEDDRVAIARMLADPTISAALREAAIQALDDGSPEALRYFLEQGQYEVDD